MADPETEPTERVGSRRFWDNVKTVSNSGFGKGVALVTIAIIGAWAIGTGAMGLGQGAPLAVNGLPIQTLESGVSAGITNALELLTHSALVIGTVITGGIVGAVLQSRHQRAERDARRIARERGYLQDRHEGHQPSQTPEHERAEFRLLEERMHDYSSQMEQYQRHEQDRVNQLSTLVNQAQTNLQAQGAALARHQTIDQARHDSHAKDINQMQQNDAAHQATLRGHDSTLGGHDSRLTTLENVPTPPQPAAPPPTDLTGVNNRIDDLTGRLDKFLDGQAQAAATSAANTPNPVAAPPPPPPAPDAGTAYQQNNTVNNFSSTPAPGNATQPTPNSDNTPPPAAATPASYETSSAATATGQPR